MPWGADPGERGDGGGDADEGGGGRGLCAGGWLQWREVGGQGRERCLELDREAFVAAGGAAKRGGAGGGERSRVRKDFSSRRRRRKRRRRRPKRLLILVNPFGGKRHAPLIFENEVKPLLDAAGVFYVMQETQYQLHAQEIARKLDLTSWDGIVCVSGDGILVEVVNGFLQRGDWQDAIKMPLGIVPGGTGNGMAKSLLDAVGERCSPSNAILSIICGHKQPLDVSTVKQGDNTFFSVLMLTWGLIADVDIESEKYRWMGSARLDFYALLRVLSLRRYHGRVHFVPAPGYEAHGAPTGGLEPPLSEWRSVEGPFIAVWLHNVPWGSADAMPAPEAKFSDGYLDVLIIKECPKSALLSLLTKLNDGTHVKSPTSGTSNLKNMSFVGQWQVKAFRLEPGQRVNDPGKGGIIDSDGEVLARGSGTYRSGKHKDPMAYGLPIKMTVDQGLATIFAPPPAAWASDLYAL
ncbi:unnamed protein product [Spirodela intermedia]|uniref:sphingosine kinase n=1 Tax=Spirodela intermedia TaxID=51605 RepID=A0A7I8JPJ7_SPIIN|nr:unnamed protein product [Spirodela intermedia]CAA6672040.1 unnamed protein product [Spirodela intermedia]